MSGLAASKSTKVTSSSSMVHLQPSCVLVDPAIAWFLALKTVNCVSGILTVKQWYKASMHTVVPCWAWTVIQKCRLLQQEQCHQITPSNCGQKKAHRHDGCAEVFISSCHMISFFLFLMLCCSCFLITDHQVRHTGKKKKKKSRKKMTIMRMRGKLLG